MREALQFDTTGRAGHGRSRRTGRLLAAGLLLALVVAPACDKARNDSVGLTNRGVEAYHAGEPEVAADYFLRAIQIFPQNDIAHYHLGLVERYDRSNLAEAQKYFAEAYRLNPDNPDAAFQLGTIQLEEGKTDTAQGLIERALKGDPQNYQAHYYLGRVFESKQKYAEADQAYRRAITLYPIYPPAFNALARMYMQFDEMDAAIAVLREGARLNPDNAELQGNLGLALMELNSPDATDQAVEAFKAALAIDPQSAIHLFNLGMAFERQGNTSRAIELLTKFIEASTQEQATEAKLARAVLGALMTEKDVRQRVRHLELPTPPPPPVDGGPTGPDATP